MLTAPYNFVPLNGTVVLRTGDEQVSMELPFPHALCGSFDLVIEAVTPLMVGGATRPSPEGSDDATVKRSFTLFDRPALPGTTLKGALRAVIEIAAFGKIGHRMDDRRFAVRDLLNPYLYTARFNDMFRPLSRAGWLRLDPASGEWRLSPCDYSLVRQVDLEALHATAQGGRAGRLNLGKDKMSAADKYRSWGAVPLTVRFTPDQWRARDDWAKGRIVSRADNVGRGETDGTIVFTGQPGSRQFRGAKAAEFIFHSHHGDPLPVPPAVREDFEHVHRDLNTRMPLPEWKSHRDQLLAGQPVPVFWLAEPAHEDRIAAMGLAMMFRLAYDRTTRQAAATASADHLSETPDFAETMFGYVRDTRADGTPQALAGRVQVESARLEHAVADQPAREEILLSPKPGFYPAYIAQRHVDLKRRADAKGPPRVLDGSYLADGKPRPFKAYTTYMDPKAVLRGWKRYPVSNLPRPRPQPAKDQPPVLSREVYTRFTPLGVGTRFRATVHVHNLRREELGALAWAVCFGDPARDYCHSLGMGRALGLGCVRISIDPDSIDLDDVDDPQPWRGRDAARHLEACRGDFLAFMNRHVSRWERSPQILLLQAMADPVLGARKVAAGELATMAGPGPFQDAKRDGEVLAPYIDVEGGWPVQTPPPVANPVGPSRAQGGTRQPTRASASPRFGRVDGDRVEIIRRDGNELQVRFGDGSIEFLPIDQVEPE
jgi:CRISPR-associated protein (TIGR03986 family)